MSFPGLKPGFSSDCPKCWAKAGKHCQMYGRRIETHLERKLLEHTYNSSSTDRRYSLEHTYNSSSTDRRYSLCKCAPDLVDPAVSGTCEECRKRGLR